MTTEELDALPPGTLIYLPSDLDVQTWIMDRRVGITNYYTLTHPPDVDGVVANRRPVYLHQLDLLPATLDEQAAWLQVVAWLNERIEWIYKRKLTHGIHDHN